MPKIHVLPDVLASQVAAGEVVERPASVVKELVENSIDAGAGEIRVDIERGGTTLIRVADDGCGMAREDALLSLERHATSKLRQAGDLAMIQTLGFRGEAVPSIASVSRFRMVTREAHAEVGTEILIEGGVVRDVRDAGCAPGTTIEARMLFFNLPARRKFLKAETTEASHIEHQLRLHALATPTLRVRLRRDDREVFDLPPVARPIDRVRQILGTELGRELISIPTTEGHQLSVEGFVLPASHARKGRRHQFVFLNGRPVEDAVISRALADGFRGALSDGFYPAAWLWIGMNPRLVDVNVHPAKREVRFSDPLSLRETIVTAVQQALLDGRSRSLSHTASSPAAPVAPRPPVGTVQVPPPVMPPALPPRPSLVALRPHQPELTMAPPAPSAAAEPLPQSAAPAATAATTALAASAPPDFRILGMVQQRYVALESDEGLVLLDPKAAHERIVYESLTQCASAEVASQALLVPVLIELDPRDCEALLREQQALLQAGIEIEPFGGNTIQVRSLPATIHPEDPRALVSAFIDELLHQTASGPKFAFDRCAKIIARRCAAGILPRLAETRALLEQLFRCQLPYCTPDGRPTLTQFSMRELDRRFGS